MIKFVSYNCNSVRNNIEIVKSIMSQADIVMLQELMLSKSDLPLLNDIDNEFSNVAFVKDRESDGINEGRPTKGVAIFWRKTLALRVDPVLVNDSVIGIMISNGSIDIMVLNVYMPCDFQNSDALHNYRSMLATLETLMYETRKMRTT